MGGFSLNYVSKPSAGSAHLYLAPLDGLRFVAFLMVFWFHFAGPKENAFLYLIERRGWVGVEVFFALSGFLLFRLFQQEHDATGRISISNFSSGAFCAFIR